MNTTFAERLKYAMEQADMSQSALSEKAGASKAAISQYLSGKNTPGVNKIKALADATGVSFDFLMGYGAAPVKDAPPPIKKISVKEAARCMGQIRSVCEDRPSAWASSLRQCGSRNGKQMDLLYQPRQVQGVCGR